MKIAIYGNRVEDVFMKDIQLLIDELKKNEADISIHNKLFNLLQTKISGIESCKSFDNQKSIDPNTDYLISLGGDGTFLDTVLLVGSNEIPVLGINTGRLGFLSNTDTSEISYAIACLKQKDFKIEYRSILHIESDHIDFGNDDFALNEVSIMKRDTSSMITIHVNLDGSHLNSYWADGLIISTATGSTAYSLSCGGPILTPSSESFVITPIAPHNLNVRPIVISDSSKLELVIEGRTDSSLVALDSRSYELNHESCLRIRKADHKIALIQLPKHTFLSSLRNKLNWGLDKRNL